MTGTEESITKPLPRGMYCSGIIFVAPRVLLSNEAAVNDTENTRGNYWMDIVQIERRSSRKRNSSVIFNNGYTRLRVIYNEASLGLALDARDLYGEWSTMQHTPAANDVLAQGTRGDVAFRYHSFDPIEIHGETRGVSLRGIFAGSPLALTALLDTQQSWCHFHFEMASAPHVNCARLQHRWELTPAWNEVDCRWPRHPIFAQQLPGNPAAFFQLGPIFSTLVADLEEGDYAHLGLLLASGESLGFAYGLMSEQAISLNEPLTFSYALCLDAHALPIYGYQQMVRFLGRNEALRLVPARSTTPIASALPALPALTPGYEDWQPFIHEGTPSEIVGLTRHLLANAHSDNWQLLEQAIGWLDRLCVHQYLCEVPGSQSFGSFGEGESWDVAAYWMPELLLRAFHFTGNAEYGYRALAAIGALPTAHRALVLGHLRPQYGDIFLNADQGEVILLADLDRFTSTVQPDGIHLDIHSLEPHPLQLVMEGSLDAYTLVVNGEPFGSIPITTLRQGIEVRAG